MKTITLVGYRRPGYIDEALRFLSQCRRLADFDRLAIFLDPGFDSVREVCQTWVNRMPLAATVHVHEDRLGVAGNPLRAHGIVFEEWSSDFNVAIEDDALLSEDALELALWFFQEHEAAGDRYEFLNLCDHYDYRGPGRNRNDVPEDPALLAETSNVSSPFAWCVPKRTWPFLKRHWNKNQRSLAGWDWSIRFAMRMEAKVALAPVLSRCRNIGFADATHENAETFQVQLGLNHSDGRYAGPYEIVNRLSSAELRRLERWMIPELPRYFSEAKNI